MRASWRALWPCLKLGNVDDERILRWHSRLQSQGRVVSREQARDAGFTDKAIDWRLRSGSWQRLYQGAYATFTGVPPRKARLWDGVHSPLERNYVHGVERAHGLPTAQRQAKRRHGSGTRYLDNLYEYGVCVELDGAAAHPAEGRWRDTHRDNANLAQGTETLRYGWPDATVHRCRTAREVAAVLSRHGWEGTLRPCSPTCPAARAARQRGRR